MELRHLRCFLAVAEELHFARAAERLHIEQSPLSRAIKELEVELGAVLFARTTRSTRLTLAGRLFLEHVRRVFTVLEQARDSVKAAANGFHGQLRVALSDGITPSRLPALLALLSLSFTSLLFVGINKEGKWDMERGLTVSLSLLSSLVVITYTMKIIWTNSQTVIGVDWLY